MLEMIETLYKTNNPEGVPPAEYYELTLDEELVNGKLAYFVQERHGWWDEEQKRAIDNRKTLSPDEGYRTRDEANERYNEQRLARARGGFVHSFSPLLFGEKKYEYKQIRV
jgi:hypothetical protein